VELLNLWHLHLNTLANTRNYQQEHLLNQALHHKAWILNIILLRQ
jgi:hypothetical protein